MGIKTTLLQHNEKSETIRTLVMCVDETQSQYNDCFTEATKQDMMLELQRDAIEELQKKIRSVEYDKYLVVTVLHILYYSMLNSIKEELQVCVRDFTALKYEMDAVIKSKNLLENQYISAQKLCQERNRKLQELRSSLIKAHGDKECQCCVETENKTCMTEYDDDLVAESVGNFFRDIMHEEELQNEVEILAKENNDIKMQLQQYKVDFEIMDKELKAQKENTICSNRLQAEIEQMKNIEFCLQSENQKLISEVELLKDRELRFTDQITELEVLRKTTSEELVNINICLQKELETLKLELSNKEIRLTQCIEKVGNLRDEIEMKNEKINCNEMAIKEQLQRIEKLQAMLYDNEHNHEECTCELNTSNKILCVLQTRIHALKNMLNEKSNLLAKLQADYEVLKNENSILQNQNCSLEAKSKKHVCQLQKKLKESQIDMCVMEDNYRKVTRDFNKAQEQLLTAVKREAQMQESWTAMEKDYCSKLVIAEREETRLADHLDKLSEELEDVRKEIIKKSAELYQAQCTCKDYATQLNTAQETIDALKQEVKTLKERNCQLKEQLQDCIKENHSLSQQQVSLEEINFKYENEMQEMYKCLADLRKECQVKNNSLVCMSAELTQTAVSRSEVCNESQYMLSCIRDWMEEQRKLVETLALKLETKQQQLLQVGYEKKALATTIKELRRVNNILSQRVRRTHRGTVSRNSRGLCAGCYVIPSHLPYNSGIRLASSCIYSQLYKRCANPMQATRRTSVCGNSWWFPKMEYLTNELRKNNQWWDKNMGNRTESDETLDESRDCGYQSSTSK